MNIEQMTEQLQSFIMVALTKAQEKHHSELTAEHVLAAMLEDDALSGIWERTGVSAKEMLQIVNRYLDTLPSVQGGSEPVLSRGLSQAYQNALELMKQLKDTYMSSAVLLAGIMKTETPAVKEIRNKQMRAAFYVVLLFFFIFIFIPAVVLFKNAFTLNSFSW